jgi:hypothetical protein
MVNNNIFLGSGASTTLIPEQDIYLPVDGTGAVTTTTTLTPDTAFTTVFKFVPNIYIGNTVDVYTAANGLVSSHTIASNSTTSFVLSTPVSTTNGTPAYALLRAYGSPSPHPEVSGRQTLLGDNWLGLMEAVTFPNLSQELKQLNLGLGGSRNFSFQYKGVRTADNGSLTLVANTGAWLYYALGACHSITFTRPTHSAITFPANHAPPTGGQDKIYIEGTNVSTAATAVVTANGPHFYRTVKGGTTIVPPVDFSHFPESDAGIQTLDIDTDLRPKNITYVFKESNDNKLPSFSLEQSMAKDPASLTTDSTSTLDESNNFVRVARGCRVNQLTLSAAEGEELKMEIDINARLVDSITDLYRSAGVSPSDYISRAGQDVNANLFNWNAGTDHASPFFFSQGSFEAFGQQFLKVNSVSIVINNNLADKRYMGGHRDMKEGIPSQRTYEITFEAVVTDDMLFKEMLNETEEIATSSRVRFVFEKPDTSEKIVLNFEDYFLDTTTITIPEDKGPISFSSTIKPRSLSTVNTAGNTAVGCEVITDFVLMG